MTSDADALFRSGTDALMAGDLPTAISMLRQSMEVAPAGSRTRANAAQNLVGALTSTYNTGHTDRSATRELVRQIQQLAADVPEPARPTCHYQAADILWDAYQRWHMMGDLVAAHEAMRLAIDSAPPDWPLAAQAHTLAVQFGLRLDGGGGIRRPDDRDRNAELLVGHAEQALRISTVPPLAPPVDQQRVLGAALRLRGLLRGDLNDTRAALELLEAARQQQGETAEAVSRAALANDIGLCWKDLRDADPLALDHEVAEFENALTLGEDGRDEEQSIWRRNLANALAERARRDGTDTDRARAYDFYRMSVEGLRLASQQVELSTNNWLDVAAAAGDWDEATRAGELALNLLTADALRQTDPTGPDAEFGVTSANAVLWAVGPIGRRVADVRLSAGDPLGAIRALERSRAVLVPPASWLASHLAERPLDDAATRRLLEQVTRDRDLCYLLDIDGERCAAVVVSCREEPRVIRVGPPTSLPSIAARYLIAAQSLPENRDYPAFESLLRGLARTVWDWGLGEVVEATPPGHELAVVATGRLGALPIHLASPEPNAMGALDRVVLSFPLSATHLLAAGEAARLGPDGDLLLLDHPGSGRSELSAAYSECAAVTRAWSRLSTSRVLRRSGVRDAIEELPKVTAVHAACHAHADLREPYTSALHLRDGALYVTNLLRLPVQARLAFLSACSTSVTGIDLPDEAIGLASTMQQAGVSGVVSSAWPVPDDAAAAVAIHFYEQLLGGQRSPAHALRAAQLRLWRGDVVGGELSARYLTDRAEHLRSMRGWLACWNAFRYSGA